VYIGVNISSLIKQCETQFLLTFALADEMNFNSDFIDTSN